MIDLNTFTYIPFRSGLLSRLNLNIALDFIIKIQHNVILS